MTDPRKLTTLAVLMGLAALCASVPGGTPDRPAREAVPAARDLPAEDTMPRFEIRVDRYRHEFQHDLPGLLPKLQLPLDEVMRLIDPGLRFVGRTLEQTGRLLTLAGRLLAAEPPRPRNVR